MEKLIYKHDELCESLGLSKYQLGQYRKNGKIQAIENRRPLMFKKDEVERFIREELS